MRDPRPPPPPADPVSDLVNVWHLLLFAARCVAVPHELLARRFGSMGVDYPGSLIGVVGVVAVPLMTVLVAPPHYGAGWLIPHLWLVVGLAVVHGVAKRARRGHVHRQYVGTPWVGHPERRYGEVAVGIVAAAVGFSVCDSLGWFHLASAAAARLGMWMVEWRDRRIVQRMKDAEAEAMYYADRLRRGD